MRISISCKNMELSEYLNDLVQKKVGKLERYFPAATEALVKLSVEKNRHIVEITIPFDGGIIRAEETSGDMYASIDKVLGKVEKQIRRYRTKLEKSLKSGAFQVQEPVYEMQEEPAIETEGPKIVRNKRFDIKPMSEDEALLQAELLGHSFYVFTNSETNQINVLYKRNDGNYGLIAPEN